MKALDTNVLVRFLVRDDEHQADKVYGRFKKAEAEKEVFFVSPLVVLELFWVLESVYEVPRENILDAVEALMAMPILDFGIQRVVRNCIIAARDTNMDLADLLIACHAMSSGCDGVITFDKKAAKHAPFESM